GIHDGLQNSGWDSYYQFACTGVCVDPSDVAQGRPAAFTVAVRHPLRRAWQVRVVADAAPLGTYPGAYQATALAIDPSVASLGVQAVYTFKSVWIGLGPSVNAAKVSERSDSARQVSRATLAG